MQMRKPDDEVFLVRGIEASRSCWCTALLLHFREKEWPSLINSPLPPLLLLGHEQHWTFLCSPHFTNRSVHTTDAGHLSA